MIENIINRLEKIDLKLANFKSKSHKIYKWFNQNPINKGDDLVLSTYTNIDSKIKPNNIICPDTKLYGDIIIPEITLNDNYLAVNGTGFNIPTIYAFFAITEGCKFLLNYNYTDYPYTCVCQVFDLKNYTGKVIKTFGGNFKTHYDFIKYVKKNYGFAKSCYMPYKNKVDIESSAMDIYRDALAVDLENNREEIVTSIQPDKYNKSWIPMLDVKAAIINSPVCNFAGYYMSFDTNKSESVYTLTEMTSVSIDYLKTKFSNFENYDELDTKYMNRYVVNNFIIFIDGNSSTYALRFKNNQIVGNLIKNPFDTSKSRLNGMVLTDDNYNIYFCDRYNKIILILNRDKRSKALIIDTITLNSYITTSSIYYECNDGGYHYACKYYVVSGGKIRVEHSNGRVMQLIDLMDGNTFNY